MLLYNQASGVGAAIHRQVRAGDKGGFRTGDERHQGGDLVHFPEAVAQDVEIVDGGLNQATAAGLRGILVRTGKYRRDTLEASGVSPTQIVASIADVPGALTMS